MKVITIKGKEYPVRQTLRALFIFEELSGKPFSGKTLADMYLHCYSVLLACNSGSFTLTFSEFIDECDADSSIFAAYVDMLKEHGRLDGQMADDGKKKETADRSVPDSSTV